MHPEMLNLWQIKWSLQHDELIIIRLMRSGVRCPPPVLRTLRPLWGGEGMSQTAPRRTFTGWSLPNVPMQKACILHYDFPHQSSPLVLTTVTAYRCARGVQSSDPKGRLHYKAFGID